jgi:hypothetical protein
MNQKNKWIAGAGVMLIMIMLLGIASTALAAVVSVGFTGSTFNTSCVGNSPKGESFTLQAGEGGGITGVVVRFTANIASATLQITKNGSPAFSTTYAYTGAGANQTVTVNPPVAVAPGDVIIVYAATCAEMTGASSNLYYDAVAAYGFGDYMENGVANNVYDMSLGLQIDTTYVAPAGGGGATSTGPVCTDGRANCGSEFGDEYAILLNSTDEQGNPTLPVYCLTAEGNGNLAGVITQADVANFPDLPETNTKVKAFGETEGCRIPVSFWVLTTGEYQMVIGPNEKGDLIRVIFSGIPQTPGTTYVKKCNVLTSYEQCEQ